MKLRNGFPGKLCTALGNPLSRSVALSGYGGITDGNIMATRAIENVYKTIAELSDETGIIKRARVVVVKRQAFKVINGQSYPAGTSDIPVAEKLGGLCRRSWEVWIGFMMSELRVSAAAA